MKLLNSKKSFITTMAFFGSVVVMAGAYKTVMVNSTDFMKDDEIKFVKRFDSSVVRNVASAEKRKIAIAPITVNEDNKKLINGKWEITSISDAEENTVYEKEDRVLTINLDLIGTGLVRIDEREDMKFDISFIHESGKTITIFRALDKGYEMINARRIEEVKEASTGEVKVVEQKAVAPIGGEILLNDDNKETVIERALFPEKTSEILKGRRVSGELSLTESSIESLNFSLEVSENETVDFAQVGIELQAGGSFQVENDGEVVSGIVANSGKAGIQINFASGKLKGLVLTFVTQEQKEEALAKEEEAQRFKEEELAAKEDALVSQAQEAASLERQEIAEEEVQGQVVEMISPEQADDQAEQEGYEW